MKIQCLLLGILMNTTACAQVPQEVWIAPKDPFDGKRPDPTDSMKASAKRMEQDVRVLATDIGRRNVGRPEGLERTLVYLTQQLKEAGLESTRQTYKVRGVEVANLEAEIKGTTRPDEIVVVGAHYDSVADSPAANDNGSGVAAVLEMARAFKDAKPSRTIRYVFFVNEEPPFFQTAEMGSFVYAKRSKDRGEKIVAMLSIETIGFYADDKGSQKYPPPFDRFFPSEGNFIAFVGDVKSKALTEQVTAEFRKAVKFPSQALSAPSQVQGVGFSDQWSFWQHGYPGIMVTDTAMFRYPHYHTEHDTPDKLDYGRMSRVVGGVTEVVKKLASGE